MGSTPLERPHLPTNLPTGFADSEGRSLEAESMDFIDLGKIDIREAPTAPKATTTTRLILPDWSRCCCGR
jgi:hypothetical protein